MEPDEGRYGEHKGHGNGYSRKIPKLLASIPRRYPYCVQTTGTWHTQKDTQITGGGGARDVSRYSKLTIHIHYTTCIKRPPLLSRTSRLLHRDSSAMHAVSAEPVLRYHPFLSNAFTASGRWSPNPGFIGRPSRQSSMVDTVNKWSLFMAKLSALMFFLVCFFVI